MKEQKQILFRSSKQTSIALPFGVRSVGYYQVPKNYSERPMIKQFVQLFWGINGKGEFIIKNKRYVLYPHHVLIYFPGDEHRIKSISQVPILGHIPLLGLLFQKKSDEVKKTELVILLIPHIVTGESGLGDFYKPFLDKDILGEKSYNGK